MLQLAKFTASIMRRTKFHDDHAWRQALKKRKRPGTLDFLIGHLPAGPGYAVILKNVLGQIGTYRVDYHWVAPFLAVRDNFIMAHREPRGAGAIYLIVFDPG
jgi:hypothetical protein